MSLKSVLLLISLLLATTVIAHDHHGHTCSHGSKAHPEPEVGEGEDALPQDRLLESTTYNPIRFKAYLGLLSNDDTTYGPYFGNKLLPPIFDYFSGALKLKYPMQTLIQVTGSTVCSLPTPPELKTGVSADFYYMFDLQEDDNSTWIADSYACYTTTTYKRPYVARTSINVALFSVPDDDDVLLHEKNTIVIMHELTHTLGFSPNLYKNFIDANGNRLSGHILTLPLDGNNSTVLNVEPLTSMIRSHFGCSSIQGAYMENDGTSGSVGCHFERRQFAFEYMNAFILYQMQISKFTLALLEGSGWYVANYSYADNYFWGQGQGCNFLMQTCASMNQGFDEFCSSTARGCANPGRGGASCSSDSSSDGCKFYHPMKSYDCENVDASDYARLPTYETYGRGLGSKCFTGTLSSSSSSASQTSFCFKYTCSGSGSNTVLNVTVGSKTAQCTKEGILSVTGLKGTINCPDPIQFCSTVGVKACPRGCMGRGNCVSGVCKCKAGYTGTDCGLSA